MKKIRSEIGGRYWGRWQTVNNRAAIFHQWEQLEATGCIDNFRILAEGKPVTRRGWYFADSDAYKWMEAAYRILGHESDPELSGLVDEFVALIRATQSPDGYLYTFNQIHYPETRWLNLQIEHELYCHGHLIEACVTGYQVTLDADVLAIARRAADGIVKEFAGKGPQSTPGHEEIEIALLRLFEITREKSYLEMAGQFLSQRGRGRLFGVRILKQNISNAQRVKHAQDQVNRQGAGDDAPLQIGNTAKQPPWIKLRFTLSGLTGKLLQQHKPLGRQVIPVGHAVRFAYLQTAGAMLDRLAGSSLYRHVLTRSWARMVARRMYITGGIGSLPLIEGFGRDYELDPAVAYAETCAALGCMFWNREMAKLTHEAKYSDLFEWQLYNAALVGMGWDGKTYLYNNPLETTGEVERRAWYQVPCCPSNLSRTWARLGADVVDVDGDTFFIQQYISSRHEVRFEGGEFVLEMDSALPWVGEVNLKLLKTPQERVTLKLRQPSWASGITMAINGEQIRSITQEPPHTREPHKASWLEITRKWAPGDQIRLVFDLPVRVLHAHRKVRSVKGKVALARGPLVYCLESIDNPQIDIFKVQLDPTSPRVEPSALFDGMALIKGKGAGGEELTFIPYHLWGNRGRSVMSVFVSQPNPG